MSYTDFINNVKNISSTRVHKIVNSFGVYDAFKYYRKKKPKDKKFVLTESEYFNIIRSINEILAEAFANGEEINFPERMGKIELRKYKLEPRLDENGKLVYKAPVDWDATLKLWYEDSEEMNKKTLIKIESRENYRVIYNKNKANYNNKSFYAFHVNRELKKKIFKAAKDGTIDAFEFKNNK